MQVFNVVTKEFKLFEGIVMRLWAIKIQGYITVYKDYEAALNCYGLDAARILLGLDSVAENDLREDFKEINSDEIFVQDGSGGFCRMKKSQIKTKNHVCKCIMGIFCVLLGFILFAKFYPYCRPDDKTSPGNTLRA